MHVLQQFTSDPQILMTAIKNFRPQEPILQPGAGPAPTAVSADMAGPGSGTAALLLTTQAEVAGFANAQVAYNLERRTLITIEAMRWLSRMLGGLQGRKNVVWLTAELPFDLIPENRNMSDTELLANLPIRCKASRCNSVLRVLCPRSNGSFTARRFAPRRHNWQVPT